MGILNTGRDGYGCGDKLKEPVGESVYQDKSSPHVSLLHEDECLIFRMF